MIDDSGQFPNYPITPFPDIDEELRRLFENVVAISVDPWHDKLVSDAKFKTNMAAVFAHSMHEMYLMLDECPFEEYITSDLAQIVLVHCEKVRLARKMSESPLWARERSKDEIYLDLLGHPGIKESLSENSENSANLARKMIDAILVETLPVIEISSACLRIFLRETLASLCIEKVIETYSEPSCIYSMIYLICCRIQDERQMSSKKPNENKKILITLMKNIYSCLSILSMYNLWLLVIFVMFDEVILIRLFIIWNSLMGFPRYPEGNVKVSLLPIIRRVLENINHQLAEKRLQQNLTPDEIEATMPTASLEHCAQSIQLCIFRNTSPPFVLQYLKRFLHLFDSQKMNAALMYQICESFVACVISSRV